MCLQVTCLGESVSTLVTFHLSVWAPDQLGGGWGREDGGRGFGLGGHSTVDSMPQGPRLNPALSSISSQGWHFFRLTFEVRERRKDFWNTNSFYFSRVFRQKQLVLVDGPVPHGRCKYKTVSVSIWEQNKHWKRTHFGCKWFGVDDTNFNKSFRKVTVTFKYGL